MNDRNQLPSIFDSAREEYIRRLQQLQQTLSPARQSLPAPYLSLLCDDTAEQCSAVAQQVGRFVIENAWPGSYEDQMFLMVLERRLDFSMPCQFSEPLAPQPLASYSKLILSLRDQFHPNAPLLTAAVAPILVPMLQRQPLDMDATSQLCRRFRR